MASLLERVQNVFDNHQDLERERIRQEAYRAALTETRDALLGSALALRNEWAGELTRSQSESHAAVHARYEARVQGLNDAFATLHQAEPGITTQLHPQEFRESASRQADTRNQEAAAFGHSPYQQAYSITRHQLDTDLAQRSTSEARQRFIEEIARSAKHSVASIYPLEDCAAGSRQATVDWAAQHARRDTQAIVLERSREVHENGISY